ncbi:MAG: ATP-dependent Clp protease adaptor ClpS [Chthonomonas sp.]|nr:ATP-dependent Clp protease adaptor ClpS [Chthonomonas sp.]
MSVYTERSATGSAVGTGRYMAVIYNNDHTSFDVVIRAIQAATRCDHTEASIEAWEAHHYGKAPIHFASESECVLAQTIMLAAGVQTTVELEWTD